MLKSKLALKNRIDNRLFSPKSWRYVMIMVI